MAHSNYKELGYAGLHIKIETRQRLNLVAAQMRSEHGRFITQDEVLNHLLDFYTNTTIPQDGPHELVHEN